MPYKLRYGHKFNTGNYTSDNVEIEREFSNEVPPAQALQLLEKEVVTAWKALGKEEKR